MELAKEVLVRVLEEKDVKVFFSNLEIDATEIVKIQSYHALQKIKAIIENDSLSDFDCIERIVSIFEEIGSDGGSRHDFG